MNNILSIIKDIVIAAVIAVFTSGLFKVANIVYQSIITILILVIIFLILRGIDKKAKRLEIMSILYVENLVLPLMRSIYEVKDKIKVKSMQIDKIKVFIVLPEKVDDIRNFTFLMNRLDTIEFMLPKNESGVRSIKGKVVDQNLLLFDTPSGWHDSLFHLSKVKGMSEKKIFQILRKMTDDIKKYTKKVTKNQPYYRNLEFISYSEFDKHYN
jgi:hypothetical protein